MSESVNLNNAISLLQFDNLFLSHNCDQNQASIGVLGKDWHSRQPVSIETL